MPNPAPLKSGKSAETFSLVESYHVHGSSRQRTLLNLGQDFAIPKEQWRKLMRMVADHLLGIPPLPFEDDALEQVSQEIVQRLQANVYDLHDPRDDRDAILTNEMEHTDTRAGGPARIAALEVFQDLARVALQPESDPLGDRAGRGSHAPPRQ